MYITISQIENASETELNTLVSEMKSNTESDILENIYNIVNEFVYVNDEISRNVKKFLSNFKDVLSKISELDNPYIFSLYDTNDNLIGTVDAHSNDTFIRSFAIEVLRNASPNGKYLPLDKLALPSEVILDGNTLTFPDGKVYTFGVVAKHN